MRTLFIQTGGTIDKAYPKTNNGYAFEIGSPAFLSVFDRIGLVDPETVSLCRKDSSEITNEDRQLLKKLIIEAEQHQIVVTHGTDTLIETARFVGNIPNKTIVFTGAFLPEAFKSSDADFNLGMAVGIVQSKKEGTFITMNGQVFSPEQCMKNKENGKFQFKYE